MIVNVRLGWSKPTPQVLAETMTIDHQPFFCEENVWRLVSHDDVHADFRWVVFITNTNRTCAFWRQEASDDPDRPIVWDYHVVAISADPEQGPMVWDFGCTIGTPIPFDVWARVSFPYVGRLPEKFDASFLVHDVATFRDEFASDRRHMLDPDGRPYRPFPSWKTIGQGHNLERWMDMEAHPSIELGDLRNYVTAACGALGPQ